MNESWINAANDMIADACLVAYEQAQVSSNGKRYRTHKPYCVPEWCKDMLKVIQSGDEYRIKAAMHAVRAGCFSLVGDA